MKTLLASLALLATVQDAEKEQLRLALKDTALVGPWIYDDLETGYAEARKSGRPLMVVIRCVP